MVGELPECERSVNVLVDETVTATAAMFVPVVNKCRTSSSFSFPIYFTCLLKQNYKKLV